MARPKTQLSSEKIQEIFTLYDGGLSTDNVGKIFGFSGSFIRTLIADTNHSKREYNTRISTEDNKQISHLYLDGYSSLEISRMLEVSETYILKYLRKSEIEIRTLTHWKAPKLGNEKRNAQIIADYQLDDRKTLKQLARETNISELTISKLLKNNDIDVRNLHNRKWFFNEDLLFSDDWKIAYFYGFCLGDGCLYQNDRYARIQIALHPKDMVILSEFCKWFNISQEAIYVSKNKIQIFLTSEVFRGDFSKYGLVPRKTYEGVAPVDDFELDFLKPFIIGLMDADGTIRKINGKYRKFGLTCSQIVIRWFERSLRRLGFDGKITLEMPENKCWGRALIYKQNDVSQIISLLEPEKYFHLVRKWDQ